MDLWTFMVEAVVPRGGATVELNGPGICGRLDDLSYYVRAAEDSKRRRIVSYGVVKDDIVGQQA